LLLRPTAKLTRLTDFRQIDGKRVFISRSNINYRFKEERYRILKIVCYKRCLPIVILLAVDEAIAGKTFDFAVEGRPALGTLETGGVPLSVDGEEVEPVRDPGVTPGAED
jgi:hypothetical protein